LGKSDFIPYPSMTYTNMVMKSKIIEKRNTIPTAIERRRNESLRTALAIILLGPDVPAF
jgi:hypothetical protein